jgi:hypothetical protein
MQEVYYINCRLPHKVILIILMATPFGLAKENTENICKNCQANFSCVGPDVLYRKASSE